MLAILISGLGAENYDIEISPSQTTWKRINWMSSFRATSPPLPRSAHSVQPPKFEVPSLPCHSSRLHVPPQEPYSIAADENGEMQTREFPKGYAPELRVCASVVLPAKRLIRFLCTGSCKIRRNFKSSVPSFIGAKTGRPTCPPFQRHQLPSSRQRASRWQQMSMAWRLDKVSASPDTYEARAPLPFH